MIAEYRGLTGPRLHDAMLAVAWLVFATVVDLAALRAVMLVAIPAVVAWGAATLHFPTRVAIDDEGIAFSGWGRAHRFAWRDVTRVRVRRFLVGDRVLVRIDPSSAWRGRYWLVDSMRGYDDAVRALEERAQLRPERFAS